MTVIQSLPTLSEAQINDIGGKLGELYDQAEKSEDKRLMQTISDTWVVVQANANTTAVAAGALTGLIEAVQQRDAVMYEHDKLMDGIEELESEGRTDNPRLRGAAHVLYEVLKERWEGEGLHLNCPGCTAHEMGWTDIDHEAINMLCHTLFDPPAGTLPRELRTELIDFLNMWAMKVEVQMDAEFQSRQRTARTG
mgnify:CR=1 FL=1